MTDEVKEAAKRFALESWLSFEQAAHGLEQLIEAGATLKEAVDLIECHLRQGHVPIAHLSEVIRRLRK